jgi:hypothetical protein
MKKLFTLTLAILFGLSIYGRPKESLNPAIIDKHVTDWVLDQLKEMGYTILPEVIVQDTLNRHKQKFSSRYETKGGRGMMMPDWANDSTWSPGDKPPKKEWDDLYYQPSKDGKQMRHQKRQDVDAVVDTLIKENPDIQVNYIYNDDPFFYSNRIGMFYHGGFNYWHYNPFFYDPWYDDFGWGWNPYYGYNYPYWSYPYYNSFYFGYNSYWGWNFGWNWYHPYNHNNYWYGQHNNFYGHNSFNQPQYGRRERPSNFTQNNPSGNRRMPDMQQGRNRMTGQQRMQPQDKPMYNQQNRRTYTPSYDNPRMSTRPQYNNSRVNNGMNNSGMNNRRAEVNTQSRTQTSTFNRSNTFNRSTESRTQTRTYAPPARSYNSTPSRSYNNNSSQGSSRSYNSGSNNFNGGGMERRSSGSSNFSSGSSNSNAGSSSGGRSSGSSSSGRR